MSTLVLSIRGMTCGGCEQAVTKVLQQVEGVEKVEVDRGREQAVVEGEPQVDNLVRAVENAGYTASLAAAPH